MHDRQPMTRSFSKLADHHFDLLVCGGGVYGAWSAYDAALRGLKVAIVDQGDWAGATSSASSKLIHGGLRYLETLDFKLVKKALRERQMLIDSAPHRVWPLRFGIPVFSDSRLNSFLLKIGLTLYDLLAGTIATEAAHRNFERHEFAKRFPILDASLLKSGFTYADAQTDDARFVLELIDGALSAGAVCVNYCQVTGFIESRDGICGAYLYDLIDGANGKVYVRQIVNTIGQWIAAPPSGSDQCRLTKGVHLVLPNVLADEALLLTAKSDGRVFFMIPWYGLTLLGTTDTLYEGDIERVAVEADDVQYLLTEANNFLHSTTWTEQDIIGRYAGLRVLKQNATESPSDVSRDWKLRREENGILTSIGGKFTSAREDAARIVDKVCENLAIGESCRTYGHPFPWLPETDFQEWSEAVLAEAGRLTVDDESAQWLIRRHGKRTPEILLIIEEKPQLANRITPTLPFIYADLVFCARHEMVVHLEDLLRRRMPLLILSKMSRTELFRLAEIVAATLAWDTRTLSEEVEACSQKWLQPST